MDLVHYPWTTFLILAAVGMAAVVFALPLPSKPSRWVIGLAWHAGLEQPSSGALWVANFVAAMAFGLVHLPRWSARTKLTPALIITLIIMNGLGGLAYGYLFFAHEIEAAILAHMVGDTVLNVISPNYLSG